MPTTIDTERQLVDPLAAETLRLALKGRVKLTTSRGRIVCRRILGRIGLITLETAQFERVQFSIAVEPELPGSARHHRLQPVSARYHVT